MSWSRPEAAARERTSSITTSHRSACMMEILFSFLSRPIRLLISILLARASTSSESTASICALRADRSALNV